MNIRINKRLPALCALAVFLMSAVCGHTLAEEPEEVPQTEALTEENDLMAQADMILENMSLEEKAAQMFVITPEALTGMGVVTQAGERLSGRSADVPEIPDMWSVGQTGNPDSAWSVGSELGSYLKGLGINVDFAPVADVVADPDFSAIGDRSFCSDPLLAGMMAAACARGIQDQGVLATLKHFPGHGAVNEDSHASAVVSDKTLEELESEDLIPFIAGIDAGVSLVMAGHITFPNITDSDIPASLSHFFLTNLLREEMGYEGLIITDALNMGAVTSLYTPAEAAVMAVSAGADLVLMPQDFHQALQGIIDAVNSGTITEERLDESVRRIIDAQLTLVKGGAKR